MKWQVVFHPLVLNEDLPAFDSADQKKILKAIRKKLTEAPDQYGAPLRSQFSGYWKLRVGDYRVVYTIQKEKVLVQIIKIGARKDFEVYDELVRRIPKILD